MIHNIWRRFILPFIPFFLLISLATPLYAEEVTITITPAGDVIDLGSTRLNTYSSPQIILVKISPLGGFDHKYTVTFESAQAQDFYHTYAYFDNDTETAKMMIYLNPKSIGKKEGALLVKHDGNEVRRVKIVGMGIGDSQPEFISETKLIEFGTIAPEKSYEKSISITTKNSGTNPTAQIRGVNASDFTLTGALQPNKENQTLTITLNTATEGDKKAELLLKDGATESIIPISAHAQYPAPVLSTEVAALSFPDTYVGATSSQKLEVNMANIRIAPMITIEGENKDLFTVKGELSLGSDKGTLEIIFTPKVEAQVEATLKIKSGTAEISLPLKAWGFEEKNAVIEVTSEQLDFGNVLIQTYQTVSTNVTIKHTSAIPTLELEGTHKAMFSIVSQPRRGSFVLEIESIPDKVGKFQAEVVIKLDKIEKRLPITLLCYAENALLKVNREKINFGNATIGKPTIEYGVDVTMEQLSEDVSVTIEGTHANEFKASKSSLERISPKGFVGVVCSPTSEGSKVAKLVLSSGSHRVEVALKAQGVTSNADISRAGSSLQVSNSNRGEIVVRVAETGHLLNIYSAEGKTLMHKVLENQETSYSLPQGTYILYYNGESVKTLVRSN
ncbi:choice-of-anchor D domain-containing protein [Porphyromonas gingivicanis]|uniref:choice-of-anchor D domain-containing protein n=1 Tax=Porphyromonas gingivicanis TaxID=266762 RepID=UPI00046EDDD6|nr:choice-of-anchor D domain-containing protein [Porphyromonas gingivicanis]